MIRASTVLLIYQNECLQKCLVTIIVTEKDVEKVDPFLTWGRSGELGCDGRDGHVLLAPRQQVDRDIAESVLHGVDAEMFQVNLVHQDGKM